MRIPDGQLVRAVSTRFVAGVIVANDRVVFAAPILRRDTMGKTSDQLRAWAAARGVRLSRVGG